MLIRLGRIEDLDGKFSRSKKIWLCRTIVLFLVCLCSRGGAVEPEVRINGPQLISVGEVFRLTIRVNVSAETLSAVLSTRDRQRPITSKTWRSLEADTDHVLKANLPEGEHALSLAIDARFGDAVKRLTFPINITVVGPFEVRMASDGFQPQSGRMKIRASTAIVKVEIAVFDRSNTVKQTRVFDYGSEGKMGDVELEFDAIPRDEIFRMGVTFTDSMGRWKRFNFVQWFVEVPHEDVTFESGKWRIAQSERHKLDATLKRLRLEEGAFQRMLGRADVNLRARLYVGGMTDTVGTRLDNQRLSTRRAAAIGRYFRNKGLQMPIFYAGFGESALKVSTPDEVPEARNRRAVYIMTSGTPPTVTPSNGWTPL